MSREWPKAGPPDEETIRLSKEGKAFKTRLSWEEHESAAWTAGEGLHGWVDRDSPIYMGGFRCSVKQGPGPLWTWKVEVTAGERGRYRVRGYLYPKGIGGWAAYEAMALGKARCFEAFRRLLVGLQAVLPEAS